MNTKPKIFAYLTFFLLLIALSFPIQIMVMYNQGPGEIESVFAKLSYLNLVVMVLCLVSALFIFRVSRATLFLVPILLFLVGINNGIVSAMGEDFSQTVAYLATLAFFFVHMPLLGGESKDVLKNPQLRWWLTPLRKRLELPLMLNTLNQQDVFRSKTFDLSEDGAFIPFSNTVGSLFDVKVNDSMSLCLNLGVLTQIRCRANVVRITASAGKYPAGIGLRFSDLAGHEKEKTHPVYTK